MNSIFWGVFRKKDNNVAQPIIASTYTDFKNLIKLFVDASSGVQCTVILQITDIETLNWVVKIIGKGHKSVFKLEKIDDIIRIINIDSSDYDVYYSRIIEGIMRKISYQQPYEFLTNKHHKNLLTHKSFFRQNDSYQCGVFAVKDARAVNRDQYFLKDFVEDPTKKLGEIQEFDLPSSYFKSVQSTEYSQYILAQYGEEVVTRKGKTLRQTHEKHGVSGYIQHFSKKFHDVVLQELRDNQDYPEKIRSAVAEYDAANITLARLETIYHPKPTETSSESNKTSPT